MRSKGVASSGATSVVDVVEVGSLFLILRRVRAHMYAVFCLTVSP